MVGSRDRKKHVVGERKGKRKGGKSETSSANGVFFPFKEGKKKAKAGSKFKIGKKKGDPKAKETRGSRGRALSKGEKGAGNLMDILDGRQVF